MKFLMNHWYHISGVLFVIGTFAMICFGQDISAFQTILILNLLTTLLHEFEEYAMPGGFPVAMNMVLQGERADADHYPLDKRTACINNFFIVLVLYIIAAIFPTWYWLGIISMCLGIAQVLIHDILINIRLKSLFSPGAVTAFFLHLPIGIYYFYYIAQHNLAVPALEWWVGFVGTPISAFATILLPILILRNRQSPYHWSADEMKRSNIPARLKKIGRY